MDGETNEAPTGGGADVFAREEETKIVPETGEPESEQTNEEPREGEEEPEERQERKNRSGSAKLREQRERLIAEKAALETELRMLREQAQKPVAESKDREPREEDFPGDYFAFLKAQAVYEARAGVRAELDEIRTRQERENIEREAAKSQIEFRTREEKFKESVTDYDQVIADAVDEGVRLPPHILQAIATSENGPALVYKLAKTPSEAARIAALPPMLAIREIGRLEGAMAAAKPRTDPKAPPPIKPINGRGSIAPTIGQSMTAYEKWRNQK